MTQLTKKQTLLKIHAEQHNDTHTYFQYEGDDDAYRVGYYVPFVDWVNMGCPQQVTVTVVPGNQMENTVGLRDAGEYNPPNGEFNIDRNMSEDDVRMFHRGAAHARRMAYVENAGK